jgi:hypothetical protein
VTDLESLKSDLEGRVMQIPFLTGLGHHLGCTRKRGQYVAATQKLSMHTL